jgi:hypothetical protein
MSPEGLEGLRRSAACAPLTPAAVTELLEACDQLLRERARIREILAGDLPTSVAGIRTALNELVRIVS